MRDVSALALPKLLPRVAVSHKGTYGRVLVVGGSRGMAGAPALTGRAALRSGAGLVTVAVPEAVQATVAGFEPCYTTVGLGAKGDECLARDVCCRVIRELAESANVVAIGPGMETDAGTKQLVGELYRTLPQPLVVDADALNALAESLSALESPVGPRILTPHPGEFLRLTGRRGEGEEAERVEAVAELCRRDPSGLTVVVLKGHRTIVAEGEQYAVNTTGNPGMATGGTGDCLTGVIAALVAQGLSPWEAARLGAHVHGLAGDLGAEELGQVSLVASDLMDFLPEAFRSLV